MQKSFHLAFIIIVAWMVGTLGVFTFGLNEQLQMIRGFWLPFSLLFAILSALICLIVGMVAWLRNRPLRNVLLNFAAILTIAPAIFILPKVGVQLHLLAYKNYYNATVQRIVQAKTTQERQALCVEPCTLYSEQPLQITFHYNHFIAIWSDLMYSPAGAPTKSEQPTFNALNHVTHISGAWYLCTFGD